MFAGMLCQTRRNGAFNKVDWFLGAIVSLVLAVATSAQGNERGGVAGRVLDENTGFGVVSATVTVVQSGDSATTDLRGSYNLRDIPAGSVTLVVTKDDYKSVTITGVQIPVGGNESLDIPLLASGGPVVRMEAFTISADIVKSSDIGLLVERQKASSISDAISSAMLPRR